MSREAVLVRLRLATCLLVVAGVLCGSRSARARGCTEHSDIVGYQTCTRYGGKWALEAQFPILASFGLRYSEFGTSNIRGVRSVNAAGFEGGFQFFLWQQLYFGFEGILSTGASRIPGDAGVDVFAIRGAGQLGYRIPLGRVALRPEVDLGGEQVTAGGTTFNRAVVEPRLTVDFFLTPHVSFGVYGAYNSIDGDGRSPAVGMGFTWHNRAFDGETSF